MGSSIQDYLKKINSRLTLLDILSLSASVAILGLFLVFLYIQRGKEVNSVTYIKHSGGGNAENMSNPTADSRPFASIHGKTYTYAWCQGSKAIASKNRIYFATDSDAERSGRTLSKLCRNN